MQQDHAVFISDTMKVRKDPTITAGLRWDAQINPQPGTPNPKYPVTGFLDWDARLLKQFRFGDRLRLDFSIEGFNLTSSSNKQFNGDGESPFGTPQAAVNPATGLAYTSSTAPIPKSSPGTDFFGGARQAQLGVRFVF